MATSVNTRTLMDGPRNVVVRVDIVGDGTTTDETFTAIDFSALTANNRNGKTAFSTVRIDKVQSVLNGFSGELLFDADTDDFGVQLANGETDHDFCKFGGIADPKSTGFTGDVLLITHGVGSNDGYVVIEAVKK